MLLEMAGIYFDLEADLPYSSKICLRSRPWPAGLAGFPPSPLHGAARTCSGGWPRTRTPARHVCPCSHSDTVWLSLTLLIVCPLEPVLTLTLGVLQSRDEPRRPERPPGFAPCPQGQETVHWPRPCSSGHSSSPPGTVLSPSSVCWPHPGPRLQQGGLWSASVNSAHRRVDRCEYRPSPEHSLPRPHVTF